MSQTTRLPGNIMENALLVVSKEMAGLGNRLKMRWNEFLPGNRNN